MDNQPPTINDLVNASCRLDRKGPPDMEFVQVPLPRPMRAVFNVKTSYEDTSPALRIITLKRTRWQDGRGHRLNRWVYEGPVLMDPNQDDRSVCLTIDEQEAHRAAYMISFALDSLERGMSTTRHDMEAVIALLRGRSRAEFEQDWQKRLNQSEEKADFVKLLKALLMEEYGHTQQAVDRIVHENVSIISQAIMQGNQALRGTAMLLDDAEVKSRGN